MGLAGRFFALFLVQALLSAAAMIGFSYKAIGGESGIATRGRTALIVASALERAADPALSEGERLAAALGGLSEAGAAEAEEALRHEEALVSAARAIGVYSAVQVLVAAALFALASRFLTREMGVLASGAVRAGSDRDFRFPPAKGRDFAPVFSSFNLMMDRIQDQERRLSEAAVLEGWREVSSFLVHQLKNPLASISLASRNLSDALPSAASVGPVRADLERSAGRIASECSRADALIARFRDLAGLSASAFAPLLPASVVKAAASRLGRERVSLSVAGPERLEIPGDARLLEEAFLNLLSNAFEACPSPPASVSFAQREEDGWLAVSIEDANGDVDPASLARAGRERFSTKRDGMGLGLLFARRVAAIHGGSFEVYAASEGFGARLRLPSAGREGSGP